MDSDLVLHHFRQVLRDVHAEAARHGTGFGVPPASLIVGVPPASLIVEQRGRSAHQSHNTGPPLRRWRVSTTGSIEIGTDEPLPPPETVGMYYDTGTGDFSLHADDSKVRIG